MLERCRQVGDETEQAALKIQRRGQVRPGRQHRAPSPFGEIRPILV
jgi:hypothetical protein